MSRKALASTVSLITLLLAAPAALAAPPSRAADAPSAVAPVEAHPTEDRLQAQAMLGVGSDNLGVGAGVRLGYTLPQRVYLGASFRLSHDSAGPYSFTWYRPAVEAGYDIGVGPVAIRPYAGVGMAFGSMKVLDTDVGSGKSATVLVGAQVLVAIPKTPLLLGGDVHAIALLDTMDSSATRKIPIDGSLVVGARF
jgi:hypothetical protein